MHIFLIICLYVTILSFKHATKVPSHSQKQNVEFVVDVWTPKLRLSHFDLFWKCMGNTITHTQKTPTEARGGTYLCLSVKLIRDDSSLLLKVCTATLWQRGSMNRWTRRPGDEIQPGDAWETSIQMKRGKRNGSSTVTLKIVKMYSS